MTNTKTIKINKEHVIELMNYLSPIPFHNSLIIGAILEGIDGYENMNYNQRNNVKLLSDFINKRQLKRTRHSIRLNDDKIQMIFDNCYTVVCIYHFAICISNNSISTTKY